MTNQYFGLFLSALLMLALGLEAVADPIKDNDRSPSVANASVTGELRKWHKVTLTFTGPDVDEQSSNNPFLNYRLNVTFTHSGSGKTYVVPGYYAADGNAAETSATGGDKWRVHFAPDETGTWNYQASFRQGTNVAVSNSPSAGSPTSFDGDSGSFNISSSNKSGIDLRSKGRLQFVGDHYLRFAETGEAFLKGGADAPENLLAYDDFDGTYNGGGENNIKSWSPHASDWQSGDPSWKGNKGRELIGAINYLANKGMNVFSFLTMNINGDGFDVWMFTDEDERVRYDVSKLAQWEILFEHADKKGMYLHFKTQETENNHLLDGGNLGNQRKLYYRELIARFSHHLALNWNLGEENTQSTSQRKAMAQYFHDHDPYRHNVVLHTHPNDQDNVYPALLGSASKLTGVSIQTGRSNVHKETLKWVEQSANSNKKWIVANDEQGSAEKGIPHDGYSGSPSQDDVRATVLWGNLMAGGAGVEYYFGYQLPCDDLDCEDWRSRDQMWNYTRHALEFFRSHLPFDQMENDNKLIGNDNDNNQKYCFAKPGDTYAIYLQFGGTTNLDFKSNSGTYTIKWYDPRSGGSLKNGSVTSVSGPGNKSLGNPPNATNQDWVILVTKNGGTSSNVDPNASFTANPTLGSAPLTVNVNAANSSDSDGNIVSYDWNFGNGTTGSGVTSNVTYNSTGTYNILLTVTDNDGGTDTHTIPINVTGAVVTDEVVRFRLINAQTDQDIGALDEGDVIDLADNPQISIRAITDPGTVGSVDFQMNGQQSFSAIESDAPYSLFGDNNGDYDAWPNPPVGTCILTATPFSNSGGNGDEGTALTISFTIVDSTPIPNDDPNASFTTSSSSGPAPLAVNVNASGSSDSDGNIVAYNWNFGNGNTGFGVTANTTYNNPGNYTITLTVTDDDGATDIQTTTVNVSTGTSNQKVLRFRLFNAQTNQDNGGLKDGDVIDLANDPNISIRAITDPGTVGSVVFQLSGADNHNFTDSQSPYALFGDSNGDYQTWPNPEVGNYTLTATPFTSSGGNGIAGTAFSISFSVVNNNSSPNQNPIADIAAGPTTGTAPLNVNLNASGSSDSDGNIVSYNWNFGNGNTASGITTNATYDTPGNYTVTLTVTDNDGATATETTTVNVSTGSSNQEVLRFRLYNSVTDKDNGRLRDGDVIDLADNPNINIRAITEPSSVGSVVFQLSGAENHNETDNQAPYALFRGSGNNYYTWPEPQVGNYTLTATPYTNSGGNGNAGESLTISFSIVDNGTSDPSGDQEVVRFRLINTQTDQDNGGLRDGDVINLATNPNINIKAITDPGTVGSVVFSLSGRDDHSNTDTSSPYSLFGDNNGDYNNWSNPATGDYILTATPYSQSGGNGTPGIPHTVNFSIIHSATSAAFNGQALSGFRLVNTQNGEHLGRIREGQIINLTENPNISIEAISAYPEIESVEFNLSGALEHTQIINEVPYALYGHEDGTYLPVENPLVGEYNLIAKPYYRDSNKRTISGDEISVSFSIIQPIPIEPLKIYPNPSNGNFKLTFNSELNLTPEVYLYDLLGTRIDVDYKLDSYFSGRYQLSVQTEQLPNAIYILKLRVADEKGRSGLVNSKISILRSN